MPYQEYHLYHFFMIHFYFHFSSVQFSSVHFTVLSYSSGKIFIGLQFFTIPFTQLWMDQQFNRSLQKLSLHTLEEVLVDLLSFFSWNKHVCSMKLLLVQKVYCNDYYRFFFSLSRWKFWEWGLRYYWGGDYVIGKFFSGRAYIIFLWGSEKTVIEGFSPRCLISHVIESTLTLCVGLNRLCINTRVSRRLGSRQ